MEALSVTQAIHINGTQWYSYSPQHGPPYGFYIGIGVLTAIVATALACCWRVNNDRRRKCKQCDQPATSTGSRLGPSENMTEPERAYFSNSRQTLPLYQPEHDFSKQLLQAWKKLESPAGTRPPSYRSRLTTDLEVAIKDSAKDDGQLQGENMTRDPR
jgi:hypothetical protein